MKVFVVFKVEKDECYTSMNSIHSSLDSAKKYVKDNYNKDLKQSYLHCLSGEYFYEEEYVLDL